MRGATLSVLAMAAAVLGAAAETPSMQTKDGHVLVSSGGVLTNMTDSVSATRVGSLFTDQSKINSVAKEQTANVQRRADGNLADLMKQLITNYGENTKAVTSMARDIVTGFGQIRDIINETSQGDAGTKGTGLPWNPIATPAVPLSDAGGAAVRIFFPTGAQLVSHPSVKQYQCQFTMLDGKGQLTKEVRKSAKVAAETARTFECISPEWNAPGDLPKLSKWKTQLTLFENDRELPSANLKSTHNWLPATPKTNMPATFACSGPKTGKTFTVSFSLVYPYGANGYKDVQVSAKTGDGASGLSAIKIGIPDTGAPERTLSFTIKTDGKVNQFKVLITATSTKTSLRTVHILTINHRTLPDLLGQGGSLGMLTGEAVEQLVKKVVESTNGGDKGDNSKWVMCTSWKKNGYSSTSHFRSNCMNKGPLIYIHKRGKNGRTFGGFSSDNWVGNSRGYVYGGSNDKKRSWLFRINPSNNKNVQFATKYRAPHHAYPSDSNYFMCFGGGHDMCSRQNSGPHAWNNLGHDYHPDEYSGSCYGQTKCQTYMGGDYSWNQQREGDSYEVYIIKK